MRQWMDGVFLCLGALVAAAAATQPQPASLEKKHCFSCSIYAFMGGETRCANPGKCVADYCYTYVSSTGVPLMLAGCLLPSSAAPPATNFPARVPFCYALGSTALCFCQADSGRSHLSSTQTPLSPIANSSTNGHSFCNRNFNESSLVGLLVKTFEYQELTLKSTGISGDYVRKRLSQMNLGDIPDLFQGNILNSQRLPSIGFLYTLASLFLGTLFAN